ncbi:hypothetical protein BU15DRAFT_87773 [Melanogaster broomeanus]|nr:hypothetical protein BU15DRAFT_87773 [Melanogaster broomeanus]
MPMTGLPGIPPRTEDMLEFIVVGGGTAGLASGHQVTVLERSDVPWWWWWCGGGVRSPPNMTCILDYWGMGEPLAKRSARIAKCTLITGFYTGATGEHLGFFIFHDRLMKTLPGNFYYLQRADLHTMLYDFAKKAGVKILHDTEVVSVDPWSGTVTTAKGAKMSADVIVGADGYSSVVRPVVVGPQAFKGVRDKYLSVNLIVPADKMRQHEDLAPFVESSDYMIWLADECYINGMRTEPNHDYALVVVVPVKEEPGEEVWVEHCPINSELLRLHLFEPRVQKLVKLAESMTLVKFVHHDPFDNWVHESGKVVLVGQAAHPIVPSGTHKVAMGIEDAMALSSLFSLPATRSQTSMLLTAYEEIRQPRCASVQTIIIDWDNADEELLRTIVADHIKHFDFDAGQGVQDWWTKWGQATLTPGKEPKRNSETPPVEPPTLDVDVVREIPPQTR